MTIASRARAMHAANPSLTIRQIANELICDKKSVRVALQSQDRADYLRAFTKYPDATVAAVREAVAAGESVAAVARRFGVSRKHVRDIAAGRRRKVAA